MAINKIPVKLDLWLENRGFPSDMRELYGDITDDVIFSAACECLDDCESFGNSNNPYVEYGDPEPWERCYEDFKAAIKEVKALRLFVNRHKAKHSRLDLSEWYDHEAFRARKEQQCM